MIERSELFEYFDHMKRKTVVLVRLFRCHGWTTVVATDRSSTYACRSITNSIEEFATAAVCYYGLTPERVVWIEHYDYEPQLSRRQYWRRDENFSLVKFASVDQGACVKPTYTHITREIAQQWAGDDLVVLSLEVAQ